MNFETFNFDPSIMAGIQAQGYVTPTPIQIKSIPPIMQGRDLIGLARPGTRQDCCFRVAYFTTSNTVPEGARWCSYSLTHT